MTAFQFTAQWQAQLVRLLMEDHHFGHAVRQHLQPNMFTHEVLSWAYAEMTDYYEEYGRFPGPMVLAEKANKLEPKSRQMYSMGLEQIVGQQVLDAAWIRDQTVDFIRRNRFVQAMKEAKGLWAGGNVTEAYDAMQHSMEEIYAIGFETVDEAWFFEELGPRQSRRWQKRDTTTVIGCGIPEIDKRMDGGPRKGELCAWMSYAKVGKTTMLANHGVVATRGHYANVAHYILEGEKSMLEDRYDTIFSQELYRQVRTGDLDSRQFDLLQHEYKYLRSKLYIRALVDKWEYSIPDIHASVRELHSKNGWRPDMIIIDYLDLLVGHKPASHYNDEFASNADAWKQAKTLANRDDGYVVWTAAQAKKPKNEDYDMVPHELKSPNLSGRYDKIKVVDFFGSINATQDERNSGQIRLWIEAVRNSPGGLLIKVGADFHRMTFGMGNEVPQTITESAAGTGVRTEQVRPSLGYQQTKAPWLESPGK